MANETKLTGVLLLNGLNVESEILKLRAAADDLTLSVKKAGISPDTNRVFEPILPDLLPTDLLTFGAADVRYSRGEHTHATLPTAAQKTGLANITATNVAVGTVDVAPSLSTANALRTGFLRLNAVAGGSGSSLDISALVLAQPAFEGATLEGLLPNGRVFLILDDTHQALTSSGFTVYGNLLVQHPVVNSAPTFNKTALDEDYTSGGTTLRMTATGVFFSGAYILLVTGGETYASLVSTSSGSTVTLNPVDAFSVSALAGDKTARAIDGEALIHKQNVGLSLWTLGSSQGDVIGFIDPNLIQPTTQVMINPGGVNEETRTVATIVPGSTPRDLTRLTFTAPFSFAHVAGESVVILPLVSPVTQARKVTVDFKVNQTSGVPTSYTMAGQTLSLLLPFVRHIYNHPRDTLLTLETFLHDADVTGASSSNLAVKLNNSVVVPNATSMNFSTAFAVTNSPAGQANVSPVFGSLVGTFCQGNDPRLGGFSGDMAVTSQGYLNNSTASTPVQIRDDDGLTITNGAVSQSANIKTTASNQLTLSGALVLDPSGSVSPLVAKASSSTVFEILSSGTADFVNKAVTRFRLENLSSDPSFSSGEAGRVIFRTDTNKARFNDSTAWVDFFTGTPTLSFQDEGSTQGDASTVNVVGAGASVAVSAGLATITIPGSSLTIQDEGVSQGTATTLNVVGTQAAIAVSTGVATLTISTPTITIQDEGSAQGSASTLNVVGTQAAIAVSAGVATLTISTPTLSVKSGTTPVSTAATISFDATSFGVTDSPVGTANITASFATPVSVGSANAAGSALTLSRSDHVHDHSTFATGDTHQVYILAAGTRAFSGNQSFAGFQATNLLVENLASGSIPAAGGTNKGRLYFDTTNTQFGYSNGTVNVFANATAAANKIPISGAGAKLDIGWLPTGTGSTNVVAGNDNRLNPTPGAGANVFRLVYDTTSTYSATASSSAANQVPFVNSGQTAVTWGLLTTSNLSASAGILDAQLATAYIKADGTRIYAGNQDYGRFQAVNFRFENRTTDVSPVNEGVVYWQTATNKLRVYDGSAWVEVGPATVDTQAFTGSGTWTKPSGVTNVLVVTYGGGASGGSGSGSNPSGTIFGNGGSGGGGGACVVRHFNAADLGATVSVTIGAGGASVAGGAAGANNGTNGNAGGDTSFGTLVKAYGGAPGTGGVHNSGTPTNGGGGGGGAGAGSGTSGGAPNSGTNLFAMGTQGAGGDTGSGAGVAEYGGAGGGQGGINGSFAGDNRHGGSSLYGGAGGGGGGRGSGPGSNGGTFSSYSIGGGASGGSGTVGGNGTATSATTNSSHGGQGAGGGGGGGGNGGDGFAGGHGGYPAGGGGGGAGGGLGGAGNTIAKAGGASGVGGDGLVVVLSW